MATPSYAAVKCLNTCLSSRKRFSFKTFSQRVEEIDIDVYRSLHSVKAEPSSGSSFFLDALIEWRELNTAEDFISFYEEMIPLVQTLPQIVLHREKLFSALLLRVNMSARLSLEPILMLIAALSRDILEDFLPFLGRYSNAILALLNDGGDRDPEILEQVFTSWSYIMMYLQKYLVKDIIPILRITAALRYFPKDYVREFMAESVSFLLRNAPSNQLTQGLMKVLLDAAKKSSPVRIDGAISLLWHVMKGTSAKLHSRAGKVLKFLLSKSAFTTVHDKYPDGSSTIHEVMTGLIQRLCDEVDPKELSVIYTSLFEEINICLKDGCLDHLKCLIDFLAFALQKKQSDVLDEAKMIQLVELLVSRYVLPGSGIVQASSSEFLGSILDFLLCVLDVPIISGNLSIVSPFYAQVFELTNLSVIVFIKKLLAKGTQIIQHFESQILRAMDNFLASSPEEVLFILLNFFKGSKKKIILHSSGGNHLDSIEKLCKFFESKFSFWIRFLDDAVNTRDQTNNQVSEKDAAILWGSICCYPNINSVHQDSLSLLKKLICNFDRLLEVGEEDINGLTSTTWRSLLGAALSSYHELLLVNTNRYSELNFFISLAKSHSTCPQVLSAVAEYLDSLQGVASLETTKEFETQNLLDLFSIFCTNLSNPNKDVRVLTLRILSYFVKMDQRLGTNEERPHKRQRTEDSGDDTVAKYANVLDTLLTVESTPISVSTSRKISIFVSRIQMSLSSKMVHDDYIPSLLHGLIGILYNRFSDLWPPTLDCLAVLIRKHKELVWSQFVQFVATHQSKGPTMKNLEKLDAAAQPQSINMKLKDGWGISYFMFGIAAILDCFSLFLATDFDCTPVETMATLLLQSLQRIHDVAESRSRHLVPLFLKFMGYDDVSVFSADSYMPEKCKGKQWKAILKEWLNLMKLMHNARSLYQSKVLQEVLTKRVLDDSDPDIQAKALDCLLNWKDEYLTPYSQNLKNLIDIKTLREEMTTWAVSHDSFSILKDHRSQVVPLVIRVLTPKVRKLKLLGSRKASVSIKQLKDLRSLCIKIICSALTHYESHDFGENFWNIFFSSVKPLTDCFTQEASSSEKPSSLFACFMVMSRSPTLAPLLVSNNLVPAIFCILKVKTASASITTYALEFIENLLRLDIDLEQQDDHSVKNIIVPHMDVLIHSLHDFVNHRKELNRKSGTWLGQRELRLFKLLLNYISDPSAAENFIDLILPFFSKKDLNTDECLEALRVVRGIVPNLRCKAGLIRDLNAVSTSELGELDYDTRLTAYDKDITMKVFVPLFFNMFSDVKAGKGEQVRDVCLDTLSAVAAKVQWEHYRTILTRCFRELNLKPDKQKIILRLICSVLDAFHFMKPANDVLGSSDVTSEDTDSSLTFSLTTVSSDKQDYLRKVVFPQVQKLLGADPEKVNVNINLVALKILKLLPVDYFESQLSSIIHRICNFLKNRLESIRHEARSALAASLKELGIGYLQFVVEILRAILKRGFELHVLGYTLHYLLSKNITADMNGRLDYCLEDLLAVVESDLFGDVAEQKEVEKIASKMKETKKRMSFETLKLIAQCITFRQHLLKKLISPVSSHLQKQLTPKLKTKLEMMLHNIALGIECNPSTDTSNLFTIVYWLIKDTTTGSESESKENTRSGSGQGNTSVLKFPGLGVSGSQNSYILIKFALDLLRNRLKSIKLDKEDEQLLTMLDPFVDLLGECLNSKYESVLSVAFRCLALLVKLPLPSLRDNANVIKDVLMEIAQRAGNSNGHLVTSCLKLLADLLRGFRISLSDNQLQMLIHTPMFVDLQTNPSPVALSLLKAIVRRKLVSHEIYDIVVKIGELMVTTLTESIRQQCIQILLQFFLNYPLSEKRLQQHIDFFLANLSYEHPSGREAVLEMLHDILTRFPQRIIDDQGLSDETVLPLWKEAYHSVAMMERLLLRFPELYFEQNMEMQDTQIKIVFNCFRMISSALGPEESLTYADHFLAPLYKVSEGFAGKVVSDEVKQLAEGVQGKLRELIGPEKFVGVYRGIQKGLKHKRDSRKQAQKIIAAVDPERHAKRKKRISDKHREHKRRKIMAMKMGRWMR
nr:unnamed protein product [Digitaria exilis]